jgi:hypothetical protein
MGLSILCVDPGMTTGLAWCPTECLTMKVLDERFVDMVSMGQIAGTPVEQARPLWKGISRVRAAIVVSESSDHFLLAGAGRGQHSLVPIKLNGMLSAMCQLRNMAWEDKLEAGVAEQQLVHQGWTKSLFVEQTPGQAKGVVKDAQLMGMGFVWGKTNERHQIDALRHLVLFIRRYQESERAKSAFAEVFQEVLA